MNERDRLSKEAIRNLLASRFKNERFRYLKELPLPSKLHGLDEACELIRGAMHEQKKITVIGDYDVDGIVASAIMSDFFTRINYPIEVVIPNRFRDGYGLSPGIIKRLDTDVIITVDNGIMAHEAALVCKEYGISLIITDHHTVPTLLPDADIIINPKLPQCTFPQKEICGANVAWYLCAGLKRILSANVDLVTSLDLLALAIIADVMPLVEINRILVRHGLKEMARSNRAAFIALKERLKKSQFSSEDVAFLIAPLLNSAGRMDDASLAVRFLLSSSPQEARELLSNLCELNTLRKSQESTLFEEAVSQINEEREAVIVYGKEWHEGVLGIVASRLCERYKKPAFVLALREGNLKGSVRSLGELDLVRLLQKSCHLLTGYGGHKGAAGISLDIENLGEFCTTIEENLCLLKDKITWGHGCNGCLGEVDLEIVDGELLELLESFEPYGEGNLKPKFSCEAEVCYTKTVGVDGAHTSLLLRSTYGKHECKAIAFRQAYHLACGTRVMCTFTISRDTFSPKTIPQMIIESLEVLGE
ncbi:MAG: single-stranded-DNA-specific exonuclease RecJ [Wolinella sp.]